MHDADPLIRRAAVAAYEYVPPAFREDIFDALADPVRDVRLQAVPPLAEIPIDALSPEQQARLDKAKAEYVASQRVDADRPEAHLNLGVLAARSGDAAGAEAEFRQALALDPRFAPAAVNLADLYRSLGREQDAEATLRDAIERSSGVAALHHSLGLLLVRTERADAALDELARAHTLEPASARYAYVYAVALAERGSRREAIELLERTLAAHPDDADVRAALDAYRPTGQTD
jgi:tetratricopeptide (TPR) repeat protein